MASTRAKGVERALVLVTDDSQRTWLPESVSGLTVKVVPWDDLPRLSSLNAAPVLIDVDLSNLSKVNAIKHGLSRRAGSSCTIVTVNPGSHLSEVRALSLGASDLLKRPLNILNLMACLHRYFGSCGADQSSPENSGQHALRREPGGPSIVVATDSLGELFAATRCGGKLELQSVRQAGDQVIDAIAELGLAEWLRTLHTYHEGTFQHCLSVTGVLAAFGHKLRMRRSDIQMLTMAGMLHDVGKARIPIEILDKPGKLTADEFTTIKRHPVYAHEYLVRQQNILPGVLDAVRHHHEYLDGSGYPDGLQGHEISDLTRIVTICDTYGALIERRSYKPPIAPGPAFDMLGSMATGGKIEHEIVKALMDCVTG